MSDEKSSPITITIRPNTKLGRAAMLFSKIFFGVLAGGAVAIALILFGVFLATTSGPLAVVVYCIALVAALFTWIEVWLMP